MKYRKKPVEVEAVRYTKETTYQAVKFLGDYFYRMTPRGITYSNIIHEDHLTTHLGDWIVKGEDEGDYYPVEDSIFKKTYEAVDIPSKKYDK
jgi:hypothetical protein